MALGYSYQPGSMQNIGVNNGSNPATSANTIPQGAAKILSLRIPRNVGPSPIAPQQLLNAPGAAGAGGLNQLIAMLLRTMQPPMTPQGGMAPSGAGGYLPSFTAQGGQVSPLGGAGMSFPTGGATPPPRIIPGEEPGGAQGGSGIQEPAQTTAPDIPRRAPLWQMYDSGASLF